jgi:hypothetical protein
MITTFMITSIVSSLPLHARYYHTLHYLDLYDTNAPRFVNSSVPTSPYIVPLLYSSDPFSHHFRFLLHPFSLFCVFTFLKILMTSRFPIDLFPATLFFHILYLYARALYEGIILDCIYITGRRSTVPLPVSNVSSCISSHPSYIRIGSSVMLSLFGEMYTSLYIARGHERPKFYDSKKFIPSLTRVRLGTTPATSD